MSAFRTRPRLAASFAAGLAALLVSAGLRAAAEPLDEAVAAVQHDWEVIRYQAPPGERRRRFESLAARAHEVSARFPGRSEPLVWEGLVLSSLSQEKGPLAALGLARRARSRFEEAIRLDGDALEGAAWHGLGALYHRVPGWPLGFGDDGRARELLARALAVNPRSIDANHLFAELLVDTWQPEAAVPYLERALHAPDRPGRQIADVGRREEARALLARITAP